MPLIGDTKLVRTYEGMLSSHFRAKHQSLDVRLILDNHEVPVYAKATARSLAAIADDGFLIVDPKFTKPVGVQAHNQHISLEYLFFEGNPGAQPDAEVIERLGYVECKSEEGQVVGYVSDGVHDIIMSQLGLRLKEALPHVRGKVRYGQPSGYNMKEATPEEVAKLIARFTPNEKVYLMQLPQSAVEEGHVVLVESH